MNKKILNYTIYYGLFISWFFLFLNGSGLLSNVPQENVNDLIVIFAVLCLISSYFLEKKMINIGYDRKSLIVSQGLFIIITVITYVGFRLF